MGFAALKTLEYNHGGNWLDRLNNAIAVDMDNVRTVALAWDSEGPYCPGRVSLYYNGALMLRLNWPLGIFLHIKPVSSARFQFGIGTKLNGRWGLILRWQKDAKAAAGAHENAPNIGQASAWARGTA